MSQPSTPEAARNFAFQPTPAVAASRQRGRYVPCSVCQVDNSEYLFHRTGVRFVRCRTCSMVYVNPTTDRGINYFDLDALDTFHSARDRELGLHDFDQFLETVATEFTRIEGRAPQRVVVAGRVLADYAQSETARRLGVEVVSTTDAEFHGLTSESRVDWITAHLGKCDVLVLNELLEACSGAGVVIERLMASLPPSAWIVVAYSNTQSLPARALRRYWSSFFNLKTSFYNTGNLTSLLWQHGMVLTGQFVLPTTQTVEYFIDRIAPGTIASALVKATGAKAIPATIRTGKQAAMFRRRPAKANAVEKLSIVFPVFNEAAYVADVLEALITKSLAIEKEIIVVESNSTDGTRDIVAKFEGRPGVTIIYEDRPRGKGHAVRTALKAITGTIVLIQDADFEYDLDDYDALIAPILQRKTAFVLGSRSLGLDDWKVRKFEGNVLKRFLLNAAQVGFAKTFNVLYQQNITDVNTMFKVFRTECLEGLNLQSHGFDLDIELACKLVKNGNAPMEVPVNYVARGFAEGKKISFVRDAFPSYAAFFRYRFKS